MRRNVVATALWMMESAGDGPVSVAEIAAVAGVSVFHLTRAFAAATGMPPARFHRLRRLTEAARVLARRGDPVAEVALGAGYSGQEAFTRAFSAAFGVTPAAVRRGAPIPQDRLQEAIAMPIPHTRLTLAPPRFETLPEKRLIGLAVRYSFETNSAIPGQWVEFLSRAEAQGLSLAGHSYGVCFDAAEDGTFTYLSGVEAAAGALPKGFAAVTLPGGRYAVFVHRGPAATLRATVAAIWGDALPNASFQTGNSPDLELYPAGYDPTDPDGRVEIWVPIAAAETADALTGASDPARLDASGA